MSADEQRLERLVATHGRRVLAYLARRSVNRDDGADVFQAVLIVAWRKLGEVPDNDQAALAWLLSVARRCLANQRRGHTRRLKATERLCATIRIPEVEPVDDDRAAIVGEALARLTEADRELLTLIYWEDLSTEQAAKVLGIKPEATRKRLERARTRMQLSLDAVNTHSASPSVDDRGRVSPASSAAPCPGSLG